MPTADDACPQRSRAGATANMRPLPPRLRLAPTEDTLHRPAVSKGEKGGHAWPMEGRPHIHAQIREEATTEPGGPTEPARLRGKHGLRPRYTLPGRGPCRPD